MSFRGTTSAASSMVARAVVPGPHRSCRHQPGHPGSGHLDGGGRRLRDRRPRPASGDDPGAGSPALDPAHARGDRSGPRRRDLGGLRAPRPRPSCGVARGRAVPVRLPAHHFRGRVARRHPHSAGVEGRPRRRRRNRDLGRARDLAVLDRQHGPHRRRRALPARGARVLPIARRRPRCRVALAAAHARSTVRVRVVPQHRPRAHARGRPRTERRRPAQPRHLHAVGRPLVRRELRDARARSRASHG